MEAWTEKANKSFSFNFGIPIHPPPIPRRLPKVPWGVYPFLRLPPACNDSSNIYFQGWYYLENVVTQILGKIRPIQGSMAINKILEDKSLSQLLPVGFLLNIPPSSLLFSKAKLSIPLVLLVPYTSLSGHNSSRSGILESSLTSPLL